LKCWRPTSIKNLAKLRINGEKRRDVRLFRIRQRERRLTDVRNDDPADDWSDPMNQAPPLEPMNAGMALDSVFRLYARNAPLLVGIVAIGYGPLYLLSGIYYGALVYLGIDLRGQTIIVEPEAAGQAPLVVLVYFGFVLLWLLLLKPIASGAAAWAVGKRYLNEDVSIRQAYRAAFHRSGVLLLSHFVVGLTILLGFVFCLVPGLILMAFFALLTPTVMMEPLKASASWSRAWSLLAGYRLKAIAVLGLLVLILMAIGLGGEIMLFPLYDASGAAFYSLKWLKDSVVGIATMPLFSIAIVAPCFDARIRKEGFDLAMLAADDSRQDSDCPGGTL